MKIKLNPKKYLSENEMNKYKDEYSEESFWDKVKNVAKKAGRKVIVTALTLYYCMKDQDTPYWAKGAIIGMLGYFIMPIDIIPDILPGGYVDDLGVFIYGMTAITAYIKQEHKDMAKEKASEWFD